MIRLRRQHWMFAFSLALAAHLAAYFYSISLPGAQPIYRGGSFDQVAEQSPGAGGVFVQLGKSGESSGETPDQAELQEQAPPEQTSESLAQGFVAGQDDTGSDAKEAEPPEIPEPPTTPEPEQDLSTPAEEVAPAPEETEEAEQPNTEIAAVPVPKIKPKPPNILPELEPLGRRLSVQGPDETTPPVGPAKTVPR